MDSYCACLVGTSLLLLNVLESLNGWNPSFCWPNRLSLVVLWSHLLPLLVPTTILAPFLMLKLILVTPEPRRALGQTMAMSNCMISW
jgi:hypothetical protein